MNELDLLYKKYNNSVETLKMAELRLQVKVELNQQEADKMDSDFEMYRQEFTWRRSLDADNNLLEDSQTIKLCNISDDHLNSLVLWTLRDYEPYIHVAFCKEQLFRKENEISVEEYE